MSRRRRDPVLEHASLMQSGVVQARMARAARPAAPVARAVSRSFDDGRSVVPPARQDVGSAEYDCSAANPALDAALYSAAQAAAMQAAEGQAGEPCDVAVANPSFQPAPHLNGHAAESAPEPSPAPAEPARKRNAMSAPPAKTPGSPEAVTAHSNPFTAREMRKLVEDDDFRADLDAILGGARPKRQATAQSAAPPAPEPARRQPPPARPPAAPTAAEAAAPPAETPSEHAIFDRIAQNMRYATAYELAPVSLGRRFDSFDRQGPKRPPPARSATLSSPVSGPKAAPAAPSTLRPYSEAERIAIYGDPRPDPEGWAGTNLVEVQAPQLAGVPKGDGTSTDGTIEFHKLGARSLADLLAAWETAGLMSRVLTFDASHATDPPHEGADAHAWAIAFDINAAWNPAGADPAGIGEKGSVHELVEIANRYGFVWGGHDPRRKAAMHFELGQRV